MHDINGKGSHTGARGGRDLRQEKATDAAGPQQQHRVLMICDACRHRRSRCSFEMAVPVCGQCLLHGTPCTTRSRKSKVESMKRSQRAQELEAEVKRMEHILQSAGIDPGESVLDFQLVKDDDEPASDNDDRESSDHNTSNHLKSRPPSASPGDQISVDSCISFRAPSCGAGTPSQALSQKTGRGAEGVFFGSASSFYILSQQGIQFIRDKSGMTDFPDRMLLQPCWAPVKQFFLPYNIYTDLFECRVYKALPPRSEVFTLFKNYFSYINRIFPMINEESFMEMAEWQYTQQKCTDVARWAIINALLALGLRSRDKLGSRPDKDVDRSWLYWKNAAGVYTELVMRPPSVLGIQALVAMAIFARMSGNLQLSIPLVTAAMKSAQALGLHKGRLREDLSPSEKETRTRVWWCIYVLDEGIGIKTGRGSLQQADDVDVDLPSQDPQVPYEVTHTWTIDLFRSCCSHAVLRSTIYRELYATQAFYKSFAEVCKTAVSLTAQLEQWKHDNPCLSCKLPDSKTLSGDQELEITVHIAHRLSYLNSMALINRMPLLFEIATRRRLNPDQDPLEHISALSRHHSLICLHAARDSLSLLEQLPWKDAVYSWTIYDFLFFAASILFSNILQASTRPETGPVDENLRMLNLAKNYFTTLAPVYGRSKATFLATMTTIMERTAKKVIDKAMKEKNNISSLRAKKQETALSSPAEQQSIASVEQYENMQLSEADLLNSLPFTNNLVAETFSQTGFNIENVISQTAEAPYTVPMLEENMQIPETYAQMYTDLYGYDMPSYMTAPAPNTFWSQGNIPDIAEYSPNDGKAEFSMGSDIKLGPAWNSYR